MACLGCCSGTTRKPKKPKAKGRKAWSMGLGLAEQQEEEEEEFEEFGESNCCLSLRPFDRFYDRHLRFCSAICCLFCVLTKTALAALGCA